MTRSEHWTHYRNAQALCEETRKNACRAMDCGKVSEAYELADKATAYGDKATAHFNQYLNRG